MSTRPDAIPGHPVRMRVLIGIFACLAAANSANAVRIRDLCDIQGARGNELKGVGLIVGLAGTGDKSADAKDRQERLLDRLDVEVREADALATDNVAIVLVTATFPAFAKEGTRIDVQVSSVYDAESLEGGTLLETHLYGIDGNVYAIAQGPLSVGGFNVGGGGAQVRKNHVTAGRVPNGAYIEREIPSTITDGERITLLLRRPDFIAANKVREAVDTKFGTNTAKALGAGSVNIIVPPDQRGDLVGFIAQVQDMSIDTGPAAARVVINERTGTLVVGGDVMIKPCQVAHGDLTIAIASTPEISQPLPFSEGETVVGETTDITVEEQVGHLMPVQGTSAADVAAALNALKVTPRDMISIFQALSTAGALEADLEVM